jgi:predicted MFS family arabinose efflux permease
MAGKLSFDGIFRALRQRNYAIYTYSNTAAMTGEWVQRVGIGWLTWELTESTTWLGIIACVDMVPTMLISPIAGAYADRSDRLRFIRTTVCLTTVQPALLTLFYFMGVLDIWLLAALSLYSGVIGAFHQAARLAIIPSLVDRVDLPPAIAFASVTYNVSRFTGPAIAGPLIAVAGVGYAFLLFMLAFSAFAVALFFLRLDHVDEVKRGSGHILADTWEGLRYTIRHPGIGPLMLLLIMGATFQRPFMELLPGFVGRVFNAGPEALGWMYSMIGLGALFGALHLTVRPSLRGLSMLSVHAVLIGAVMVIVFAMISDFWLAMACLPIIGATLSTSAAGVMTLVQHSVESNMRGRVLSLYGLIFRGGPAVGALIMGYAAEQLGLRIPVVVGALLCLVLWAWVAKDLKRIAGALEPGPMP